MPPEVLEQFDLSQSPLGEDLLAEDIGDLLDGNTVTSHIVGSLTGIEDEQVGSSGCS